MKANGYLIKLPILLMVFSVCYSCNEAPPVPPVVSNSIEVKLHTEYSQGKNEYFNFNSPKAINRLADIENEYFSNFDESVSKYYGTVWRQKAETYTTSDSTTWYNDYLNLLGPETPDSLHCTLYAYEGLKAGLTKDLNASLDSLHQLKWKKREIAGWSIGYLLVKEFGWNAYLLIDTLSAEYNHCINAYKRNKSYPVWRQPDIPLNDVYIIGKNDSLVKSLFENNEFGWGFSEQGIHTWVSRFDQLKECNWNGSPSKKYEEYEFSKPLFLNSNILEYRDYLSHVIIFPPKLEDSK